MFVSLLRFKPVKLPLALQVFSTLAEQQTVQ